MRQQILKKQNKVEEIASNLENNKVVAIVDLTSLPSAQFQSIKSKIKEDFKISVAKKSVIKRALEKVKSKKENLEELEKNLDNCIPALVFSNKDPFRMSKIFKENKSKSLAKPGQISPISITIESGPTSFAPGPIIGELGQAGIKAAIEQGKVVVKEPKLLVEEGQEINQKQADLLAKFNITPIEIGLNIKAAYENGTIYDKDVLIIDEEKTHEEVKTAFSEAFNLAMFISYPTKETVELLIKKSQIEANSLHSLIPEKTEAPKEETEEKKSESSEEPKEEAKETPKEETKEEVKENNTQKSPEVKTTKNTSNQAEYTEETAKKAQDLINKLKDSNSGG